MGKRSHRRNRCWSARCNNCNGCGTLQHGMSSIWKRMLNVKPFNVFNGLLGAKVEAVTDGSCVLKDAVTAALRSWVAKYRWYPISLVGSALGPHPFPKLFVTSKVIIGREANNSTWLDRPRFTRCPLVLVVVLSYRTLPSLCGEDESVAMYGAEAAGLGVDQSITQRPWPRDVQVFSMVLMDPRCMVKFWSLLYLSRFDYPVSVRTFSSITTILNVPVMFLCQNDEAWRIPTLSVEAIIQPWNLATLSLLQWSSKNWTR